MKYDFESRINRTPMNSKKWVQMYDLNPNVGEGVMPFSVADMEFKNAPEIIEGLTQYIEETVLGYTLVEDSYFEAVQSWFERRHQWKIERDSILLTPGAVTALYLAVDAYTEVGDGVLFFTPVYGPFQVAAEQRGRKAVRLPLIEQNLHYSIDFDRFEEEAAKAENKMLIFCSPHNPVGRVWTAEELERIAEIVVKYDLIVISDDVWADFVFKGSKHLFLEDINAEIKERTITLVAASKSFNLAGGQTTNVVIPNADLRKTFADEIEYAHQEVNMFGLKVTELAYNEGEAWFDEVKEVIRKNQEYVVDTLEKECPEVKAYLPEGTYVLWLDFRGLGLTDEEAAVLTNQKAQFITNQGTFFGPEGSGFQRVNVAVPYEVMVESTDRLIEAIKAL